MSKNLRLAAASLVLVVVVAGLLAVKDLDSDKSGLACGMRDDEAVKINSHSLSAEVASTAAAQQRGLSGRSCIGANEAMLFVFNQPGYYRFWMINMKFPIDMVWLGADHRVVTIKQNVLPKTYPITFTSTSPAQYVLELQANRSQSLGMRDGTVVNF